MKRLVWTLLLHILAFNNVRAKIISLSTEARGDDPLCWTLKVRDQNNRPRTIPATVPGDQYTAAMAAKWIGEALFDEYIQLRMKRLQAIHMLSRMTSTTDGWAVTTSPSSVFFSGRSR